MDAAEQAELAALAKEMIDETGRPVTLVQLEIGPTDPNNPWDGVATPRSPPEASISLIGCFLVPDTNLRLGRSEKIKDLLQRSEKLMYVASSLDLSNYNEVIDGSKRWTVLGAEVLEPGPIIMLWWFFLAR
jgi:hypothetical protein